MTKQTTKRCGEVKMKFRKTFTKFSLFTRSERLHRRHTASPPSLAQRRLYSAPGTAPLHFASGSGKPCELCKLVNSSNRWKLAVTNLKRTSTGDRWVGEVDTFGWWYGCWYGKKPKLVLKLLLPAGDFDRSFFFKLRFSGVASSGAESSTSRSLSGELGDAWCRDGDNGIEYDLLLTRGLLGEDSDPVSWSVSAESRAFLLPTVNWNWVVKIVKC